MCNIAVLINDSEEKLSDITGLQLEFIRIVYIRLISY